MAFKLNDENFVARFDKIVLTLIGLTLLGFAVHTIVAYDIWWQIKSGQLVRESGWPTTDPFSYGFPDRIWIEVRWLYSVFISLVFENLGLNFLIVIKAAWLAFAGFCLWKVGDNMARWTVNLGLIFALILLHQRTMIRPELVTYGLFAVYLLIVRRFQLTRDISWLIALPALQVFWVNAHSLYILGPALLWAFAIAEGAAGLLPWKQLQDFPDRLTGKPLKILFGAAAISTIACIANPYGLQGALFAFELFSEIQSNHVLSSIITEFRSPFVAAGVNLLFVTYVVVVLVSALGFFLNRKAVSPGWIGVWAAFLYLSILAERNLPLFGIVAAASIMLNFGSLIIDTRYIWATRFACGAFCIVMLPMLVSSYYFRSIDPDRRFGFGVAERRFPIKALSFVESENLPRPVLTSLGEASYALFEGGPKSVYVDGRLEIYGGDNVAEAMKTFSSPTELNATTSKFGVETVVFHHENEAGMVSALLADATWVAVYFDDSHIVFVKAGGKASDAAARLKIDWQNPQIRAVEPKANIQASKWFQSIIPAVGDSSADRALGRLFMAAGNSARGIQYLEQAVRNWPDDGRACFQLGVMYRSMGREAEGLQLLSRVTRDVYMSPASQAFAAMTYEASNNPGAAADAWLLVSQLGDQRPVVYERLAQTSIASQRWEGAFTALSAMTKNSPNDFKTWNNLGIVADKLNKKNEALQAFERSLQISPSQAQVLTQVGVIKMELRDTAGARQAFERALAADPSFEPARQQLSRLPAR